MLFRRYCPTVWKVRFPQAEKLKLKAINETVPVYYEPFQITQEVEIAGAGILKKELGDLANGQSMIIEGIFRYQACDDEVCYMPETLSVKFELSVAVHH